MFAAVSHGRMSNGLISHCLDSYSSFFANYDIM